MINYDTFSALGFVLLPDGTIYFFGKAMDMITREEAFDPYLWQWCNHEESLRRLIRMIEVNISAEVSYLPNFYSILTQLVQEHHIIFINRTKKSVVKQATIFLCQTMTKSQYEQLMYYQTICNECEHMTISYLKDGSFIEKNNITDLKAFIDSNCTIQNQDDKKKVKY